MQEKNNENNKPCIYFAIGLLSGSSLDGLDIAYCTFQKKHITPLKWDHALILSQTVPYPPQVYLSYMNVDARKNQIICQSNPISFL